MHAASLADFIRLHGDSASTAQFKLFCKANGPLAVLHQRWVNKMSARPRELHIQLPEYDDLQKCKLLKGLLRVAGFTQERPVSLAEQAPAAALADEEEMLRWEDGGDLCCMDSVDTDIVERSCSEPDAHEWLGRSAHMILARFGCKLEHPYQVADVVRALKAALKTVGLPMCTVDKRKRRHEDGSQRTVTFWSLVSVQRDSLL